MGDGFTWLQSILSLVASLPSGTFQKELGGAITWPLAGLQEKQRETLSGWEPVRAEGGLGKLRSKGEVGCSYTWLDQKAAFH